MTKPRDIPITLVRSDANKKETRYLEALLKKCNVTAMETHNLENYHPDDSPRTTGIYLDGRFYSTKEIRQNQKYFQSALKRTKPVSITPIGSTTVYRPLKASA